MRASPHRLAKGFIGRSVDELKRRSSIAWNLEAIKGVQGPRPLYAFDSPEVVRDCIVMSDEIIGGSSACNLDFVKPQSPPQDGPCHARFHGFISTELPLDRPKVERSGFAAFRTPNQSPTVFGRSVWDIDPYIYLALRIKSDGRAYFINIQTESVEPTDLHQHRLFAKRPGQWETVMVKWNDFVRTNHGFVVEPQTELLRQKVRTIGIGLTDRVKGPFDLCIQSIWASNNITDGAAAAKTDSTVLRNRKGQTVQW
ncbi:hypothetical protein CDD82_7277 [Ophiocordyceps australis]|uniref:NADH:ubiquinone oxidoreductase intermediate-associated protein 30 domain-containing protein n=1 Tax=Ophiocordyceps australis TaxID=1399860 RepID=A0A2C5ZRR6_9HYPO|nr:hypothetical protein CDD82_7277 [Ophiocordyceps australis]